ncbi:hypothetical protein [Pseudomonas sp.]|uniref:hypothetical protein n=1 Tax=Pseudomonas sp. TaxID=306 RepID=UPI0026197273|nr:hypothetical protein [Pseudomonas sp.]
MSDTPSHTTASEAPVSPEAQPLPWADVQPEHFSLLRLAPLQTDRSTGARPLRFVQFEYAERTDKDVSLLRLKISLPGQHVRKEQNQLDIWLDHATRRVSISPERGLQVEPVNRGLGRFVMAQGIQWLQQKGSRYSFDSIELPTRDALNEDTRQRRDHSLRTQGFDVVYEDAQQRKARIDTVQISELYGAWNTEKVQVVSTLDAAQMLQQAEQNLLEQEVRLREKEDRISRFQREDIGLRFTITCLVAFAVFQAALLIWIATHR